jgi:hypothetical protein
MRSSFDFCFQLKAIEQNAEDASTSIKGLQGE